MTDAESVSDLRRIWETAAPGGGEMGVRLGTHARRCHGTDDRSRGCHGGHAGSGCCLRRGESDAAGSRTCRGRRSCRRDRHLGHDAGIRTAERCRGRSGERQYARRRCRGAGPGRRQFRCGDLPPGSDAFLGTGAGGRGRRPRVEDRRPVRSAGVHHPGEQPLHVGADGALASPHGDSASGARHTGSVRIGQRWSRRFPAVRSRAHTDADDEGPSTDPFRLARRRRDLLPRGGGCLPVCRRDAERARANASLGRRTRRD